MFGDCRMCALANPTVDDMPTLVPIGALANPTVDDMPTLVPIGALANPTVDDMPSLEVDVRFQPRAWYDAQACEDWADQRNGPVPIQRIYISQSRQRAYEETILQLSRYEKTIMVQSRDRVENNHFVNRTAAMIADARAAGQESVFICETFGDRPPTSSAIFSSAARGRKSTCSPRARQTWCRWSTRGYDTRPSSTWARP